jgi:hypothetical protein
MTVEEKIVVRLNTIYKVLHSKYATDWKKNAGNPVVKTKKTK